MRYATFVFAALVPLGLLLAKEDAKPLTPEEAGKRVDEKVTVQMDVKSTGSNSAGRFLNSMTDYRDRNNFAIVIFRSDLGKFKKAEIEDPDVYYKGKTIQITGTVSVYRGQMQIKVDDPAQIKVIDKDAEEARPKTPAKAVKGKGGKPK
jgi:DNA/RNA endonuclease YhcR with UshA esterase domain